MPPMAKRRTPLERVLDRLENVRASGDGWTALCPAHDDNRSSLNVREGDDGRVLLRCFAGCEVEEIVEALGLKMRDLFPRASADEKRKAIPSDGAPDKKVVVTYDYCDEVGRFLFQIVRFDPKDFRPRRRGPDGDWVYDLNGVRRVMYNLLDVITATHVIVVEGEKDADRVEEALRYFGKRKGVRWAVTTCPGGAKGWRAEYAPYCTGKSVYILPDNDEAGRKFGQDVARSVSTFARRVKVIELPGLEKKEDVSNYLDRYYAKDLQRELRKAPIYRPTPYSAGGDRNSFNLQSLRDCFDAPEEEQQWLVEGILPTGGMSVMSAKPKVGKSTVARQLALNVATGTPFLGRETRQREVIYLALEEKLQEVKDHFRALGATGDEPIFIHCGSTPVAAMEEARVLLQKYPGALLIIDPLFKFARVKDGNDYIQVTSALEPILALARETDAHILCVHHASKGERADPTDAILGSTAIFANVDSALMLNRYDDYRTISSRQRYGEDLPETVLEFDSQRRAVILGASRGQADQNAREQQILKFLESNPGAVEADILAGVVGRRQNKVSDLRNLVGTRIKREGKGGKKDPYRYSLSPWSRDSDTIAGTTTRKTSETMARFCW
jgi:5S rRNA maturation endonuclease (ribonuclease M5)